MIGLNVGVSFAFGLIIASLKPLVHYETERMRSDDEALAMRELQQLPTRETFDFIIVGGGSAGSVVARQLSEHWRVLVLEAGGEPPQPEEYLPNCNGFMYSFPEIHWKFNSTKHTRTMQEANGYFPTTAGKMFGGSGSHNRLQYERGSPYDYERWANITGDDSWRYENILKYFLHTENYRGRHGTASGHHRVGGYVDVSSSPVTYRDDIFFSAGRELGYDVDIDQNGPQRVGFAAAEYNIRDGHRCSAYDGYLKPVRDRKNLVLRRYSIASKVLFDGLRATGVEYHRHGVPRAAYASKEVILCAGTYVSPMVLMMSGIGRKEQLDQLGVRQLVDLPVGENLQDHIFLRLPPIDIKDRSVFKYSAANVTFEDFDEFKAHGTGFLAAFDARHEAYIASSRAARIDGHADWPDIQLYLQATFYNGTDYLSCNVNFNRYYSRGRLLVNPAAKTLEDRLKPLIDYNFLSNETDVEVLLEGIETCVRILNTKTFQSVGARYLENTLPACDAHDYGSKDYWLCYIRQRAQGANHIASSNSMGGKDDPKAVLDSKMRVRGVQNLRVVDASAMPLVPNTNMMAAAMMLGEKASDDISQAWQ